MFALFLAGSVWAKQMGPRIVVTGDQVAAAVANSPLDPRLQRYAADAGRLSTFESGGNLGIYNGSCCTGVLQVNRGGLRRYCGCTPEEYARMPLQRQVDVWAEVTNINANTRAVRNLMARETFDGRPVDGAMVLSCIQLGPGNCARTIAAGTCATRAGADSNGTNFCTMAARIRGTNAPDSDTGNVPDPGNDGSETDAGIGPGIAWNPIAPEVAFANGAGVDMAMVKNFVHEIIAAVALLWTAWVAQAQLFLYRRQRIDAMTGVGNILSSAVLTLLILFFTLD